MRAAAAGAPPPAALPAEELARRNGCLSCHDVDRRVVGPAFREVAARYRGADMEGKLADKVRSGGSGSWGAIPMPPHADLAPKDAHALARWVLGL